MAKKFRGSRAPAMRGLYPTVQLVRIDHWNLSIHQMLWTIIVQIR